MKRMTEEMLNNLNRASMKEAPTTEIEVGSNRPNELMHIPHVIRPETLATIRGQDPRAQSIADRWACMAPTRVKELEESGRLLQQLEKQARVEERTLSDARVAGQFADMPDSEILEMWGVDPDVHLYR